MHKLADWSDALSHVPAAERPMVLSHLGRFTPEARARALADAAIGNLSSVDLAREVYKAAHRAARLEPLKCLCGCAPTMRNTDGALLCGKCASPCDMLEAGQL